MHELSGKEGKHPEIRLGISGGEASWRAGAASNVSGSSGLWISGCFHPRGIVLPVCSGIRFHVRKHESDGRAEPEGS